MNAEEAAKLLKAEATSTPANSPTATEPAPGSPEAVYKERIKSELAELSEYRKALEQEFASMDPDDPSTAAAARREVVTLVPEASTNLRYLLNHASSENIKWSATRYVLDMAIKQAKDTGDDDAMSNLIKSLTATTHS